MSDQLQPTRSPHPSQWEMIDETLLKYTYDADQAIYPAPSLTYNRLKSWVESCPELCIVLRRGHDGSQQPQVSPASTVSDSVAGTIIVIPLLREYWVRLTAEGKLENVSVSASASASANVTPHGGPSLQEHDVNPRSMFPPTCGTGPQGDRNGKVEVGLHVFHIERFAGCTTEEGRRTGFTQLALEEIRRRVAVYFPSWSVSGYSALTVTPEGNIAFKRSGFSPTYTSFQSDRGKVEMMMRKGA